MLDFKNFRLWLMQVYYIPYIYRYISGSLEKRYPKQPSDSEKLPAREKNHEFYLKISLRAYNKNMII